jgi:hypothetical protein
LQEIGNNPRHTEGYRIKKAEIETCLEKEDALSLRLSFGDLDEGLKPSFRRETVHTGFQFQQRCHQQADESSSTFTAVP